MLLALLLGFAAHRASICTVKAVVEVISSRRGYMLASLIKTVLWAMAVILVAALVWDEGLHLAEGYLPSLPSFAGGVIFGMGAAMNRGCAFSTLNKLGSGDLAMVGTLGGFVIGVVGFELIVGQLDLAVVPVDVPLPLSAPRWLLVLVLALTAYALFELTRLWRRRDRSQNLKARGLSPRYRLSTAAMLIGLSGGALYLLNGDWVYTANLTQGVEWFMGGDAAPPLANGLLFGAVLIGIWLSAWQRQAFALRWPRIGPGLMHLLGGVLMGLGAALVPGGNDALILSALPVWLPHALPAFLGMLLGISAALVAHRLMTGDLPRLSCAGDLCRED
ncbi:MAG: YeeE/YedE thiosulfate transporter family protein [Pseudomonadota bacterium]